MPNRSVLVGLALGVALVSFSASAEDKSPHAPFYQMTNTMLVNDPTAGAGIEMIFQVDELPEGGLTGSLVQRDLGMLCKTWAQNVIAHVAAQTKLPPPKFLQVMVKRGGIVGIYARMRFSTDGKQCLDVKD